MSNSIRLTVGQAVVRFVAKQYVERDGRQNRFIEGFWGIFGHGNVSGFGQGIVEEAGHHGLKFYRPQNEQGMVHIAAAFAKHRNRLAAFACTTSIGPGAVSWWRVFDRGNFCQNRRIMPEPTKITPP